MEKRRNAGSVLAVVLVTLVMGLFFHMNVLAETVVTVKFEGTADYDRAASVFGSVNNERIRNGVPALAVDTSLQSDAMQRAREIALDYSHTRPDGNRFSTVISFNWKNAGENIAAGQTTAGSVMTDWMNSSGHRANILNSIYTRMGVGCFYQNGTYYWVQLFADGNASGTLGSGQKTVGAQVRVLPSRLRLSVGLDATGTESVSVTEGQQSYLAPFQNNPGSNAQLKLYSGSFDWTASGTGYTLYADTGVYRPVSWRQVSENPSVILGCGGVTWSCSIPVKINHLVSGSSCTKDLYCEMCGVLVEKKRGHDIPWSAAACTSYYTCKYCGERVPPVGHRPQMTSATCTKDNRCSVCNALIEAARGHNYTGGNCQTYETCSRCGAVGYSYGDHVWSSWTVTGGGAYRMRRCSVCGVEEYEKIQTSGSGSESNKKVSSIKITGNTTVLAGKKVTLKAVVTPTNAKNKAVTWSVSNKNYASVSSNGILTAKAAGAGKTVTVTATARDGSGKKASVRVKINGPVKKIVLKASKTLLTGKNTKVKATVSVGNGGSKALSWSSSNQKYATVSSAGVVTARSAGAGKTVTITAKAKDGSGKKASIKIKLKGAVKKISLKAPKSLKSGKSTKVKATVSVGKGGSKALSWSSSNKSYATVSSSGTVRAAKAGRGKTVTITAKARDGSGKKASIKIKIK